MLPVLRPHLLRPRLSRQILEACRLDIKLAQIGLEFSMQVKDFVPATVDDPLASAVNCASCQLPLGYSRLEITPVFRGSIAFACTMRIVVVAFF